mgnify:CR=1 FL=1
MLAFLVAIFGMYVKLFAQVESGSDDGMIAHLIALFTGI